MVSSIKELRELIKKGKPTIGSWMQIPSAEIAEILAANNSYDWIVIDMEHGSFCRNDIPSIIRSMEIYDVLPFVRLQSNKDSSVKDIVDCGFYGYIVPMIESSNQLENIFKQFNYPPIGERGVGFSRSNQYGINFKTKINSKEIPFLVAMIETKKAIDNLKDILSFKHLDAVIIGPYDLSASLNICGEFENPIFLNTFKYIQDACKQFGIPFGIHLIEPCNIKLKKIIKEGSKFIPFSIDTVMLSHIKPEF